MTNATNVISVYFNYLESKHFTGCRCHNSRTMCMQWGANDLHAVQLMPLPPRHLLLQQNPEWFILLVLAYPGCLGKRPLNECSCCLFHQINASKCCHITSGTICRFSPAKFHLHQYADWECPKAAYSVKINGLWNVQNVIAPPDSTTTAYQISFYRFSDFQCIFYAIFLAALLSVLQCLWGIAFVILFITYAVTFHYFHYCKLHKQIIHSYSMQHWVAYW